MGPLVRTDLSGGPLGAPGSGCADSFCLAAEPLCGTPRGLRDFRQGGPAAIAKVRKYQPAAYMKICALLVPKEMKLEHSTSLKNLSDEQLDQAIELVKGMLEERAAEGAKVIEGAVETAALPAPAELEQPQRKRPNRLLEHVNTAIGPKASKPRKRVPSPVGP
jgi:hypothetical protein